MSYITDIKSVFEGIYPDGTFLFYSEVMSDNRIASIEKDNYPIFIIDDEISSDVQINQDARGQKSPKLTVYCFTKFDSLENEVNEGNTTRLEQFDKCVDQMESLAIRVMAKYMREFPESVNRDLNVPPRFRTTHKYNAWTSALYGVQLDVLNLNLKENINYCNT